MLPISAFRHAVEELNKIKSKYSLDISGVAGFFGGDVAVAAMGTVHIYTGRKWLGWYNSPGSYEIARSYGVICNSRLWDGLYPGVNVDPARLFGLDGKDGPAFRGIHSGTFMAKTGHLGYLLADECMDLQIPECNKAKGRTSRATTATVVDLKYVPETNMVHPALSGEASTFLAFFPIVITLLTCVMCLLVADDWFAFSLILYGAIASGLSCLTIGSGKLTVTHPDPAAGAPRGDGVLGGESSDVVILLGEEGAVNTITRGAFSLHYNGKPQYHLIGICSLLLTIQFIAQLLVIPLGSLFGQLMFLASLFASWMYTAYLASIDRESLQRRIVNTRVLKDPRKDRYQFGTRTAMVVFVLLVFRSRMDPDTKQPQVQTELAKVLDELLPNDTTVWKIWKDTIKPHVASPQLPAFLAKPNLTQYSLNARDTTLLENLFGDAEAAIALFREHEIGRKTVDNISLQ